MASNLSQIGQAVENLSITPVNINTTDFFTDAIQYSNDSTNGWSGIIILIILSFTIILHIIKNKQSYLAFDDFTIFLISASIIIDVAFILLIFGLMQNYYLFIFIFTSFFVMCMISVFKKDLLSPQT